MTLSSHTSLTLFGFSLYLFQRAELFALYGTVLNRFPEHPVSNISVSCFDDDLGYDDFIGTTTSDSEGRFSVNLTYDGYDPWTKNNADVYCVFDAPKLVTPTKSKVFKRTPTNKGDVNFGITQVYLKREVDACRSNGCGPIIGNSDYGNAVPDFYFTAACNQHDCCYDMCFDDVFSKKSCDLEFFEMMLQVCQHRFSILCRRIALLYYTVVLTAANDHWCLKQCRMGCNTTLSGCHCDEEYRLSI